MKESQILVQHQQLQQHLTAQQVQFVRMLEMSAPELEEEVRRVVDENPALEATDPTLPAIEEESSFNESAEDLQRADYSSPDEIPFYRLDAHNYSPDDPYFGPETSSSGVSLAESLMAQIRETDLSDSDRIIAEYIIGNLDDNGYLTRPTAAIANDISFAGVLNVEDSDVRRVLSVVRSLEPAGVAAFDLRDCLLLQLDRYEQADDPAHRLAREIVANWFDVFSKKHYDRLMGYLNVDKATLSAAIDVILSLSPKPGTSATDEGDIDKMHHITPDFIIENDDDTGTITVSLYRGRLPELSIDRTFVPAHLPAGASRKLIEANTFIKQKYDEAQGFINRLTRRSETLLNVMQAIVHLQSEFFRTYDTSTLRPMILKDIAAITGYDLSVISRATAGKYVLTPMGIFPLKLFFNESTNDDSETSSHEILNVLRQVIENEDHHHPYSDKALLEVMEKKGYNIARRTITKYRERLGIPVSRLRKQL